MNTQSKNQLKYINSVFKSARKKQRRKIPVVRKDRIWIEFVGYPEPGYKKKNGNITSKK